MQRGDKPRRTDEQERGGFDDRAGTRFDHRRDSLQDIGDERREIGPSVQLAQHDPALRAVEPMHQRPQIRRVFGQNAKALLRRILAYLDQRAISCRDGIGQPRPVEARFDVKPVRKQVRGFRIGPPQRRAVEAGRGCDCIESMLEFHAGHGAYHGKQALRPP